MNEIEFLGIIILGIEITLGGLCGLYILHKFSNWFLRKEIKKDARLKDG